MNMNAEEFRAALLDAYVHGFLLEHHVKSWSRFPLAGCSVDRMRELLRPSFDEWCLSQQKEVSV